MFTETQLREPSRTGPVGLGRWSPNGSTAATGEGALTEALHHVSRPVHLVDLGDGRRGVARDGVATVGCDGPQTAGDLPLVGFAPSVRPEQLGDSAFRAAHGLRYAYVAGAMANGIGSVEIVEAMGRAGMIGFFGAAGLDLRRIETAIDRIQQNLGALPFGFNLIHSPSDPRLEAGTVDLYLRRGVRLVSASAYLDLTLALVRYRVTGIERDADGRVVAPNRIIGKVSRVEVARKFLSPPPEPMLSELVADGTIRPEQARWAASIPICEDLTAEADSGGHTDNRPALTLLPTMLALRDEVHERFGYECPPRVGIAGGIATPSSAAAAFAMGAAYILTGTINQACREAGTSDAVKRMLADASQADVTMAPAADMFEMGVKVQVLKRGTMFALRARKLYELYRTCADLDDIPAVDRLALERDYFRGSLEQTWARTKHFFEQRDPAQLERAARDPKHKMALVFRSYLGQSSEWANRGEPSRKVDYQIWCGPAMGAFNEWTRGSALAQPENRDVVTVALNLLVGAAALTRVGWLRTQGVPLPPGAQRFAPRTHAELDALQR